MQTDSTQAAHELGDASFYLHDYHFRQDNHNGICTLQPQNRQGYGNIYQVQPTDGLFLSTGSWIPYASMERKYEINQKLVKIYYLESGGVTLIQNGRKAQPITEGIHLYLNKPSQGRVLYQPNIPISYASVLLFEDYIEKNLQDRFTPDDFDYAEVYDWKAFDYNTPEIGTLFLQIRDKLIAGETSRLYYESKVGELLSIVAGNFHKQRQEIASKQQSLSKQEKKALESVRQAIECFEPAGSLTALQNSSDGTDQTSRIIQSHVWCSYWGLYPTGKNAVCAFIDVKTEFDNRQYCRAFGLCQCK